MPSGVEVLALAACSEPGWTMVKVTDANALHGERGQGIVALVANAGGEDGAVGGYGHGGDFAARGFEEHVAFALRADAIDEAGAVGAGDQISFCVPGESANVLFVAFEKQFGMGVGICGIDAVDCAGSADGDVELAGGVEGHVPDVVGF